jgi:hypothetical protein
MLYVYAGMDMVACDTRARKDLPAGALDISKTPASNLVDALLTIFGHQPTGRSVYIGFIDPILMLSQQDEVRCRKVFRAFDVYMVVSNPFILPFSWKNGLKRLVVIGQHTTDAETPPLVDNGGSAHVSPEV